MMITTYASSRAGKLLLGTFFVFGSAGLSSIFALAQEPKKDEKSSLPPGAVRRFGALPGKYGSKSVDGHTGGVYDLAISPDGKYLASRGMEEADRVRVWDVGAGKTLHKLDGERPLAWSGDGKTLITGGREYKDEKKEDYDVKDLLLWDAGGFTLRKRVPARDVLSFSILPDGRTALLIDRGSAVTLDLAAGERKRELSKGWTQPVAFSPDGKRLAFTRASPLINLANAETGEELPGVFQGKNTRVSVGAFSPDGRWLAAGDEQGHVHLWEVKTPPERAVALSGHTQRINALLFSPDGRFLVTTSIDRTARIWDLFTQTELMELRGHVGNVTSLAFSADGAYLATGGGAADTTILLWDFWKTVLETPETPPQLTEAQHQAVWNDLEDAGSSKRALAAVGILAALPKQTLPLVQKKLETYVEQSELGRIAELIKQLDDDRYLVREQATEALIRLRRQGDPLLRKALQETRSEEALFRLRLIISYPTSGPNIPPAETRRYHRVVLLLERMGTPEAKKHLQHLAEALPSPDVNREARAALARLERARK
jgi:WD40 repeat protein